MPTASDLIPVSDPIKVAFASGPSDLNPRLIDRVAELEPELPLYVVSEFEPHRGTWIPYHVYRSFGENRAAVRDAIGNRRIALAVMVLAPGLPLRNMRRIARDLRVGSLVVWDESLRPITGAGWLVRQVSRNLTSPRARLWLHRLAHPWDAEIPVRARLALLYGLLPGFHRFGSAPAESRRRAGLPAPQGAGEGTTVVIPSRDGRHLLETMLPPLVAQVDRGEIIVSDNGSSDGTFDWLAANYPQVHVIRSSAPLSFARAVNSGIAAASFHRILLLNNDMIVAPDFIRALHDAFIGIPDLFCATAQIFFPPGVRREETGKAVWRRENALDFPVRCDDPLPGEDLTWVLYGSGGCSLFDTEKLCAIGGVSEVYDPAYVEDLDFGYRAWKLGWPSVLCSRAQVEHRHRATATRFFTARQLDFFVEVNYLRFLANAIGDRALFRRLWTEAIRRLQLMAMEGKLAALDALRAVPKLGPRPSPATGVLTESEIFALGNGDLAVFPGGQGPRKPTIVVASPYLPFPLSHGGAVRMFNLMKQAAAAWDLVLVAFCGELATPPPELLSLCREVILVRRHGSHYRRDTLRPDTVEEFDSECFRACLKQTVHRWKPFAVQLEFTQMAQYAGACAPAKTLLVEHDITFDLQEQLLAVDPGNREMAQQLSRWKAFETAAWRSVDCVVTMSGKDRAAVTGARRVECLPNGVDTERFSPDGGEPEPRRLLFVGSFAHRPNVLGIEFFLREVWPLLGGGYRLHVIAGAGAVSLEHPGVEVEGFVADVRSAYRRAEVVIVPLTASAGTNIKVLEAMAMGRAVVSTPTGVNGLDVSAGEDVAVAQGPAEFAEWIRQLCTDSEARKRIESAARQTAFCYDWREIARAQSALYEGLKAWER